MGTKTQNSEEEKIQIIAKYVKSGKNRYQFTKQQSENKSTTLFHKIAKYFTKIT